MTTKKLKDRLDLLKELKKESFVVKKPTLFFKRKNLPKIKKRTKDYRCNSLAHYLETLVDEDIKKC